ncbi:hypothetical protein IWQ61_007405 [Dispira simplex]|nr:hypothetical protein IWQ61_007405 [Dispira simplex]
MSCCEHQIKSNLYRRYPPWYSPIVVSQWLVGIILALVLLPTFTSAKIIVNRTDTRKVYFSYDFQGNFDVPFYIIQGPLIVLDMGKGCRWVNPSLTNSSSKDKMRSLEIDQDIPSDNNTTMVETRKFYTYPDAPIDNFDQDLEYNGTIVFFHQSVLIDQGCNTYVEVVKQAPEYIKFLDQAEYPPVKLILFSSMQTSVVNFGLAEMDYFDNYRQPWEYAPEGVQLGQVNDFTGEVLRRMEISMVTVRQDSGVWNRFLRSKLWFVCRAIDFVAIVPAALYALYQFVYLMYTKGWSVSLRLFIFSGCLYYMIVALIVPMGKPAPMSAQVFRYTSWIVGFVCINVIVFSWTRVADKIAHLRFIWLLYVISALHILATTVVCVGMLVYTFVHKFQLATIILVLGQFGLTHVIVTQSVLLFSYGTWFIIRIRHMPMSAESRKTLTRLTILIYCLTVGILCFTATWYVNLNPQLSPLLVMVRNIMLSCATFFLFGTVFYFLRVRDYKSTRHSSTSVTSRINCRHSSASESSVSSPRSPHMLITPSHT